MPIVPCTAMIEVAFVIGYVVVTSPALDVDMLTACFTHKGVAYPVNPLDVVTPIGWHKDGTVVCHGAFVTLGEPDVSEKLP